MRVEFVVDEVYVYLNIEEVAANLDLCKRYHATYDEKRKIWHSIMPRKEFDEFIKNFQSPSRIEGEGLDRVITFPVITEEVLSYLNSIKDKLVF